MATVLSRNPTVHLGRKDEGFYRSYEADKARSGTAHQNHGWRIFSTRRSSQISPNNMMSSLSYRRDRARKRHIFLQTYKLSSIGSRRKLTRSRKLKNMAVKAKSAVVAVLSFMRGGTLRSSDSRSAIRGMTPSRGVKVFC